MQPVDFYRRLLTSAGLIENQEGLGFLVKDSPTPITVKGKVLVLPTQEVLDNFNQEGAAFQVFHPACENVMRNDSPVFNFTKKLYRASIFVDLQQLMLDLIDISSDTTKQGKFNKAQRQLLSNLTAFDEKTKSNLEAIFDKIDINGDNRAVDFTVIRGGSIEGTKFNRVGVARLPFLMEVREAKDNILGVKVRKKDIEAYNRILDIIFSDTFALSEQAICEVGTNETTAPSFIALTKAYLRVKNEIVRFHAIFKDKFHSITSDDLGWAEGLDEMAVYRNLIPAFPGNEGDPTIAESAERKQIHTEEAPVKPATRQGVGGYRQTPSRQAQKAPVDETPLNQPMTYAQVLERARLARESHDAGRDYDRRGGYRSSGRRRYDDIDVSDVNPDMVARRQEEALDRDRYCDDRYYDDRYGRSRYDRDRYSRYGSSARPRSLADLRGR